METPGLCDDMPRTTDRYPSAMQRLLPAVHSTAFEIANARKQGRRDA